ncbi:MAG: hypothetical protein R3B56_17235 [Candidatus Scalinduaceae bacterium]
MSVVILNPLFHYETQLAGRQDPRAKQIAIEEFTGKITYPK